MVNLRFPKMRFHIDRYQTKVNLSIYNFNHYKNSSLTLIAYKNLFGLEFNPNLMISTSTLKFKLNISVLNVKNSRMLERINDWRSNLC